MKKSKKLSIVSAALGATVIAATPLVITSCSCSNSHNYQIEGVADANISVNGSSSERTLNLLENSKAVTEDVVWSIDQTEGRHSRVSLKGNTYEVLGTSEGTDTYTFIGVCDGSKATATMTVSVEGEKDCYVSGNSKVNVRVGRTTDWIDLHLIDKETEQEAAGTIMWSIYGTGTHAHAQRNSDEDHQNQYNITGENQGDDTLKARAIRQKPDGEYVIYEFEIPVHVDHTYHIANSDSTNVDDVTVKYGKTTDLKTFRLLDENNDAATDQQSVSYSIKGTAQKDHSTIALEGTNNNQYKITGNSYGQNDVHTIIASYEGDTFESDIKVNVDHTYKVKGAGVDSPVHVKVGEETDWLTLSLVDENGQQAVPKKDAIQWSIYNLDGLDGGITRTDIVNLYKVKGIANGASTKGESTQEQGHFKLSARATIDGEIIECKIDVYIEHNYHIKFYDKIADALTVTLNEDSKEQQFKLIDDEGNEVTDPQNVTYKIKDGEAAKGTNSTISLTSGTDKYKVHGDVYGDDSHTIVATYKGKDYETKLNVNVDHQYHVVASNKETTVDLNNVTLRVGEETGWIYLSLLDENNQPAEAKESLTWSIYNTDGLQNAVGRDSETTNGFNISGVAGSASAVGTSTAQPGKFAFKAKAVLDKELEVEFTINVNIKHHYVISPISDIYLNTSEVSSGSTYFELYDDENNKVESGVTWSLTPTTGTYSSATKFVSETGEYHITAGTNQGIDTYKVKANYDNKDWEYQFNVIVADYTIQGVSNKYTLLTVGSSVSGTVRLYPVGQETPISSGVTWSVSFNTTETKTKPAATTFTINENTGDWKISVDGLQITSGITDEWTVKAHYNNKDYTFIVSVLVRFW